MPGSFAWLTFATAKQQLAQRLSDPSMVFWSDSELGIYIQQALRQYNCLTLYWKQDFTFNSTSLWNSLGSLASSPRLRTITDTYCYTDIEFRLLEPASGSTWTGTTQFSISDLSQALQRRRDEILQVSACNDVLVPGIPLTPDTTRTFLSDNAIDVPRVRYLALQASTSGSASSGSQTITVGSTTGISIGNLVSGTGINYWSTVTGIGSGSVTISIPATGAVSGNINFFQPATLYRDDTIAQEFYESPLYQQAPGTPQTFSLSSEPPLSFDVDIPPAQPGNYEAVILQSGAPFNPPNSTLLGIPDDFAWAAEYGALADLLGRESEATDRERAEYYLKRYQDGLQLLIKTPWIMLGKVNGYACNIDSIADTDRYMPGWDLNPTYFGPVIVVGGIDFFAAPVNSGIGVTVLGNAPVPVLDSDYVQVSRSNLDTVLDFAQASATQKLGGAEWKASLELEARAIQACAAENTRLKSTGAFADVLLQRGQAMDRSQERYSTANQGNK